MLMLRHICLDIFGPKPNFLSSIFVICGIYQYHWYQIIFEQAIFDPTNFDMAHFIQLDNAPTHLPQKSQKF